MAKLAFVFDLYNHIGVKLSKFWCCDCTKSRNSLEIRKNSLFFVIEKEFRQNITYSYESNDNEI